MEVFVQNSSIYCIFWLPSVTDRFNPNNQFPDQICYSDTLDWTEDTDLSGEAGSMSWLILRTNGAFLWRLMMASACEDEDRAESLLSSSVERAEAEAAVLSVDTADTEAGCWLATWEGEATLVTSDRVRPQCEAAGPRNLGS